MKLMAKKVERAWEYGAFQKYFDERYPTLTDTRGRYGCSAFVSAALSPLLLWILGIIE